MFEMFEFSGYFDTSGYATTRCPVQSNDVLYPCTTLVIVYDLGPMLDRLDKVTSLACASGRPSQN